MKNYASSLGGKQGMVDTWYGWNIYEAYSRLKHLKKGSSESYFFLNQWLVWVRARYYFLLSHKSCVLLVLTPDGEIGILTSLERMGTFFCFTLGDSTVLPPPPPPPYKHFLITRLWCSSAPSLSWTWIMLLGEEWYFIIEKEECRERLGVKWGVKSSQRGRLTWLRKRWQDYGKENGRIWVSGIILWLFLIERRVLPSNIISKYQVIITMKPRVIILEWNGLWRWKPCGAEEWFWKCVVYLCLIKVN